MYRRVEIGLSLFTLLLSIGVLVGAGFIARLQPPFEDPVGARGFAYVVGTFTAGCAVILLVSQALAVRRGAVRLDDAEDPDLTGDDPRYPASSRQAFTMVAATFVYAVALPFLGYLLATIAFVAAGMFIMGSRGLGSLLAFPSASAVVSYVLFDTVLGVRLPPGVLGPLLRLVGLE
jgi:putative tricarboxylic transport membrane protein